MAVKYNKDIAITRASIDICTKCQLKCVSCSTSKGLIKNGFVKEGCMSFDLFKSIVDSNPDVSTIELSNWGEIFLNPEILDMMKYAYEKGVSLYCANGSNFNYVPDDVLEGLVKYHFECLNLSIDGVTQEVYSQYRRNGHINKVFENITKLNSYKKKYGSDYPKLSWQFIVFGHNEHEIPLAKKLCKEYGMVFNPKMNHSDYSPIINSEYVKQETGLSYSSRKEYKQKYGTDYKHPCYQCLYSPQINWNGDVLGCCVNKWKGLGNVKGKSLSEIMESVLYQHMLRVLFGLEQVDDSLPCYYCPNMGKVKEQPLTEDGFARYSNYVPIALKH